MGSYGRHSSTQEMVLLNEVAAQVSTFDVLVLQMPQQGQPDDCHWLHSGPVFNITEHRYPTCRAHCNPRISSTNGSVPAHLMPGLRRLEAAAHSVPEYVCRERFEHQIVCCQWPIGARS